MNELYNEKYRYERLIKILNSNYNKLNTCLTELKKCRNKIGESFTLDGIYYSKNIMDNLIKSIENDKNLIINSFLPQARYQYNKILYDISKM